MKRALAIALLLAVAPAASGQDGLQAALAAKVRALREAAGRCVVAIEIVRDADPEGRQGSGGAGTDRDYYNRPAGPCTGTIWSADGYILTTSFNASGDVKSITVTLSDGREFPAERLGWDKTLDIALLKIEAADLPVPPRADPAKAAVGDLVAILGRAPDKNSVTVNRGILSALNRFKNTALQTDAELNYGNAGGPLLTLDGALLGLAGRVQPRAPWGQSSGVGFATKLAEIDKALPELKKKRRTEKASKEPWMGITLADPKEGDEGAVIDQVVGNSPAEEAGLESGDVIVAAAGKPVKTGEELRGLLAERKPGDEVELKVRRQDAKGAKVDKAVKVRLAENPN